MAGRGAGELGPGEVADFGAIGHFWNLLAPVKSAALPVSIIWPRCSESAALPVSSHRSNDSLANAGYPSGYRPGVLSQLPMS